jgi:citrate lyase subunit beta/citryl-CoA lyase
VTDEPSNGESPRSRLLVGADHETQIRRAGRAPADEIVLDLADLDPADKDTARASAIDALEATDYGDALVAVRVNPIGEMWAYRDIVDVVERVGEFVDAIVIPGVLAPGDVEFVDTLLGMIEQRLDLGHRIGIEAEIATPQALALLDEIALASERLEALVLDEAGIAATLGLDAAGAEAALGIVRVQVAVAARAAEVVAVLAPDVEGADPDAYRTVIERAEALGYDGARCTHPTQVDIANQVFAQRA